MELILNALWLALVAAALVALVRKYRSRSYSSSTLASLGALLCASALLFPSISITDDLHQDTFIIEDSNSTKRVTTAVAQASPAVPVILIFVGFLLISPRLTSWRMRSRRFAERICAYPSPVLMRRLLGRAPPLALC